MRLLPDVLRAWCCRRSSGRTLTDDGLFAWYARLIEGVADARFKLLLYHLPQVSAVPLSVDLVARLAAAFPGTVAGIKDSEGNWEHTSALLARVPELTVVIGHEPHLPRLMRAGGAGTICGVANVYPDLVQRVAQADRLGRTTRSGSPRSSKSRSSSRSSPDSRACWPTVSMTRTGCAVRAPLVPLDETQRRSLRAALERAGFAAARDRRPTMTTGSAR